MSWFTKKDKKEFKSIEDLPPLPDFEEDNNSIAKNPAILKNDFPALPALPSADKNELPSQKPLYAANDETLPPLESLYSSPPGQIQKKLTQEIQDFEFKDVVRPIIREIKPSSKIEPIYVRIDKYQESLIAFHEIKKKMLEIENLLRDLKEAKMREDNELQGWEEEVKKAKDKLAEIDSTLFQKIE